MSNYEALNLVLLLFITLLEFVAFGWLIIRMRKSATERDKILRLEESQIAMERRILKALDINQLVSTPDLVDFLDHISIEGDGDVNLEEVDIDSFPESMKKKNIRRDENEVSYWMYNNWIEKISWYICNKSRA